MFDGAHKMSKVAAEVTAYLHGSIATRGNSFTA